MDTVEEIKPVKEKQSDEIRTMVLKFGGPVAVASICHIDRSGVSKWKSRIPVKHAMRLYMYALHNKIVIDLYDLIPPASMINTH